MRIQSFISQHIYLTILAILGWFALVSQLYLNLRYAEGDTIEILVRYISYFTITTNLLVAICCTTLLVKPGNQFFSSQKTLTAITAYILVVGIVYNLILRSMWNPTGLQKIVDEILHVVVPLMFLFYWIFFTRKNKLEWTAILPWLIYPLVYLIFILLRGTASGYYPYPFMNVDELGFKKVLINSAGITVGLIVISLVLIGVGNRQSGIGNEAFK
ncbi:MAG: Pr6Pr family membrane protein [Ferruginibacter sp.]